MNSKPVQVLSEAIDAAVSKATAAAAAASAAGSTVHVVVGATSTEVVPEFDTTDVAADTRFVKDGVVTGDTNFEAPWKEPVTPQTDLYASAQYSEATDTNNVRVAQLANGKYLLGCVLGHYITESNVATKTRTLITDRITYTGTVPLMIYSNPAYKIYLRNDGLYVYFLTDQDSNPYSRLVRCITCFEVPSDTKVQVNGEDLEARKDNGPSNPEFTDVYPNTTMPSDNNTKFEPIKFGYRRNSANPGEMSLIGDFVYMGDGDIPASTPVRILPEDYFKTTDDTFLYQVYQSEKFDIVLTAAGLVLWSHKESIPNGTRIKFKGTVYLSDYLDNELHIDFPTENAAGSRV